MATVATANSQYATLVASTVTDVAVPAPNQTIRVVNLGTTAAFATVDASTPTVAGSGTWPVPAGATVDIPVSKAPSGIVHVLLISSGTPQVGVLGLPTTAFRSG